jgi:hypothetical protein
MYRKLSTLFGYNYTNFVGGEILNSSPAIHNYYSNAIFTDMFDKFIDKTIFLKENLLSDWARVLLWRMVRFTDLPYLLKDDRSFFREYSHVDKLAKDSVADILWYASSILGAHLGEWGAKIFVYDHKGRENVTIGIYSADRSIALISIKGTSTVNDAIADLNFIKKKTSKLFSSTTIGEDAGEIHRGFLKKTRMLLENADGVLSIIRKKSLKKLFIVGHSLGGAEAFLLTYYVNRMYPHIQVVTTTVGAPKVGNLEFKRSYDFHQKSTNSVTYRIYDSKDPVPRQPTGGTAKILNKFTIPGHSISKFHHVGVGIRITDAKPKYLMDNRDSKDSILLSAHKVDSYLKSLVTTPTMCGLFGMPYGTHPPKRKINYLQKDTVPWYGITKDGEYCATPCVGRFTCECLVDTGISLATNKSKCNSTHPISTTCKKQKYKLNQTKSIPLDKNEPIVNWLIFNGPVPNKIEFNDINKWAYIHQMVNGNIVSILEFSADGFSNELRIFYENVKLLAETISSESVCPAQNYDELSKSELIILLKKMCGYKN